MTDVPDPYRWRDFGLHLRQLVNEMETELISAAADEQRIIEEEKAAELAALQEEVPAAEATPFRAETVSTTVSVSQATLEKVTTAWIRVHSMGDASSAYWLIEKIVSPLLRDLSEKAAEEGWLQ